MAATALCASCWKTQANAQQASVPPVPRQLLLHAVQSYGAHHTPLPTPAITPPANPTAVAAVDDEVAYQAQVTSWLAQRDFDKLDDEARALRASKARMRGGIWKLADFYEALNTPRGDNASDDDFEARIAILKDWIRAKPKSAAARIALAGTYTNYGEHARGQDYAYTVSSEGWSLMHDRNNLAAATLLDAAKLQEKCPAWYEVMQYIATGEGWSKQDTRQLFDNAVVFEPDYYHFYREYANYLLPRWYGAPGEVEAFATESANRVKGKQGDFIYFEISSMIACQCDSQDSDMENLSWPRIKSGYAALTEMWGTSKRKANRFAHMAVVAGDKTEARAAFEAIGNNWDIKTWHSDANFVRGRTWALS